MVPDLKANSSSYSELTKRFGLYLDEESTDNLSFFLRICLACKMLEKESRFVSYLKPIS